MIIYREIFKIDLVKKRFCPLIQEFHDAEADGRDLADSVLY